MKAYAGLSTSSSADEPTIHGPYDQGQYAIEVTPAVTVYGDREWLEALRDVIAAALQVPRAPAGPLFPSSGGDL